MKILVQWFLLTWSMFLTSPVLATESPVGVYRQHVNKPITEVYDKVYNSLEDARFFVVFEPNIGANLSRFSEKWADDYNQNNLSAIRSMVFCNGWYANKVSNLDPDMMGFCPLHLTLIEREGETTVLFNRPSVIAQHSPAKELFIKIEAEVIEAIDKGLR
ncbi:MAG: DUF302 domain-containing protein [Gammaproteobacteria bacterium]|nr:DUF302 domain-containing protein [Gammaproteobacteria bacterium]